MHGRRRAPAGGRRFLRHIALAAEDCENARPSGLISASTLSSRRSTIRLTSAARDRDLGVDDVARRRGVGEGRDDEVRAAPRRRAAGGRAGQQHVRRRPLARVDAAGDEHRAAARGAADRHVGDAAPLVRAVRRDAAGAEVRMVGGEPRELGLDRADGGRVRHGCGYSVCASRARSASSF